MREERESVCVCVCMRKDNTRRERKRIDTETDKSRRIGTQKKNTYTLGYKSLNFNETTLKKEKP